MNQIRTYASLDVPDSRILRNVQSFETWVRNSRPLVPSESWLLKHRDDLVSLSNGQEYGWLDAAIEEACDWVLPRRLMKV